MSVLEPSRDTTPAAERVRVAAIRAMSPSARLRQAFDWSESVRRLALSSLRKQHPDRSDIELVELIAGTRLLPPAWPRPHR